MKNTLKTFMWFLAAVLITAILYYSSGRYTNTNEILLKVALPIIGILVLAALLIPNYKYQNNSDFTKIWYRHNNDNPNSRYLTHPVTWQGWLIDILSAGLGLIILIIGVKSYVNSTSNPDADLYTLIIKISPILVILFLNLWVRNKHSDYIT